MRRVPIPVDPKRVAEWQQRSRRNPLRPVSARAREATGQPQRRARSSGRAKGFPPAVAALIDARDQWCVRCGSPDDLHRHHRRLKGSGGDPRPHTQCACNGVRLCATCHLDWAHSGKGRREAEAEGFIIPRSETRPWTQPVMVRTEEESDSGFSAWPTCDGGWVLKAPEGAEAA